MPQAQPARSVIACIRTQSLIGFVCRKEFYYLELLVTDMIGFICRQSHFLLAELVAHLGIGFISGAKLMTHSGPLG